MFIALDGMDGAGKSTQLECLCDWLGKLGRTVVTYRDPGSTELGEAVRELLLHREEIPMAMVAEMFLYMAARSQLVAEKILPDLKSGKCVIADRFLLSNVVYQGCAGGLDPRRLWEIGEVATMGVRPDVTIVIDVPVEISMQRIGTGGDRLEKRGREYFERVRQGFLSQIAHASAKYLVVDGTEDPLAVFDKMRDFLSREFYLS